MMRKYTCLFILIFSCIQFLPSCSTIDKASVHGFNSGYYAMDRGKAGNNVYVDVTDEKIDVYGLNDKNPEKEASLSVSMTSPDSMLVQPLKFRKQGLDIDITTVLLKYRPALSGAPAQLNTDLNLSIYAGWRFDRYRISSRKDPLGRVRHRVSDFGYDIGLFAGPGSTPINPFTTGNRTDNEYAGMIIQTGIAGFIESNMASFGLGIGFDHLLNRDRDIWIYNKKPWIGFIVGIALK